MLQRNKCTIFFLTRSVARGGGRMAPNNFVDCVGFLTEKTAFVWT